MNLSVPSQRLSSKVAFWWTVLPQQKQGGERD
jgi:hypothetical protein